MSDIEEEKARIGLARLESELLEDLMSLTEEELIAELEEAGENVDELVRRTDVAIERAMTIADGRPPSETVRDRKLAR